MEKLFKYNDLELYIKSENDDVFFNAAHLAKILDYSKTEKAVAILDDDEKLILLSGVSGQNRKTWFCTESGFFHLVLKSTKPEAKAIRKWVTSEVLPAIRSQGHYSSDQIAEKHKLLENTKNQLDKIIDAIEEKRDELKKLESDKKSIETEFWRMFKTNPNQLEIFQGKLA